MSYSPTQIQHTQVQEDDEQSNGSDSPQEDSNYIATQVQDNDLFDEEDDPVEHPLEEQDRDEEEQIEEKNQDDQNELEFDEEEKEEKKSLKKKKKKTEAKEKKRRQRKDDDKDYQDEEGEKSANEEEENNEEEVDTKKKKRKRLQKGKEKRKRKKETTDESIPSNEEDTSFLQDEENEGSSRSKQNTEDDEFNFVLKEVKSRRSASSDKLEATAQPQATELIKRINAAYSDDVDAYHKKKPALNKLQLLPEVVEACKKIYLQGHLISEGILGALEKWIVPDKDLPHPSINIQTGVLTILNDLPVSSSYEGDEKCITKELLKSSKIPKTIKQIANNPSTTPNNRKLAKKIVERWSRLVYQLPSEYGEMYKKPTFVADETQPSTKPTPSFSKTSEPIQRKKPKSNSIRASIPKKESFDFTRLPASKAPLKKEKAENEVHKRLLNVGTRKR